MIEREINALFDRLDENGDRVLTEQELFKGLNASSHNKHSLEEVKEIMRILDTDNNGKIDKEEFRKFMIDQVKKDIISAEDEMEDLRAKFKSYDLDGSGWLSADEM